MQIDTDVARMLGWPKLKYARIERERRWLCDDLPADSITGSSAISDLYLDGTQLRLRAMRSLNGGDAVFKLARKADISPSQRLITTIYLIEHEHDLLSRLPGHRLEKIRHSVRCPDGFPVTVDVFGGTLAGLQLMELEFNSDAAMGAYLPPHFAGVEVTDDRSYTGAELAQRMATSSG